MAQGQEMLSKAGSKPAQSVYKTLKEPTGPQPMMDIACSRLRFEDDLGHYTEVTYELGKIIGVYMSVYSERLNPEGDGQIWAHSSFDRAGHFSSRKLHIFDLSIDELGNVSYRHVSGQKITKRVDGLDIIKSKDDRILEIADPDPQCYFFIRFTYEPDGRLAKFWDNDGWWTTADGGNIWTSNHGGIRVDVSLDQDANFSFYDRQGHHFILKPDGSISVTIAENGSKTFSDQFGRPTKLELVDGKTRRFIYEPGAAGRLKMVVDFDGSKIWLDGSLWVHELANGRRQVLKHFKVDPDGAFLHNLR